MTYFCYVDESGTPEVPGTSSHFVLVGVAIPIDKWGEADRQIAAVLARYGLANAEIHTAWLARPLIEQDKIKGFDQLNHEARRSAVSRYRAGELLRLRKLKSPKAYRQAKKNYAHTEAYVHLTRPERHAVLMELVDTVGAWDFAVLFAEAIDKLYFDDSKTGRSISEQAFEQLVSRFQQFLQSGAANNTFGVLVHDNNQTVAKKHTDLMRSFHEKRTLWATIDRLAETPLFVDSKLTRLVQIADLCSYALRRYVENDEEEFLDVVLNKAHHRNGKAVGVRHYSPPQCRCKVCKAHRTFRKPKVAHADERGGVALS